MPTKTDGHGSNALGEMVKNLYCEGQQDYYLEPVLLVDPDGVPVGRIRDGDGVIFCCRRGEREVQLTEAFTEPDFSHFPRPGLDDLSFAILTMYHEKFKDLPIAFAPKRIEDTLGELVSRAGLRQLRTAESEKFAHITFFLNGGASEPFDNEVDVRVPSPKGIAFDQVPELSLAAVAAQVKKGISEHYDFIASNFANGDVIGHLSNDDAKLQCASFVDTWLGEVVDAALYEDYVVLITADHGILEVMTKADGSQNLAHTTNPVPFMLIDPRCNSRINLRDGKLSDIAPTILSALGIQQSDLNEGISLAPDHRWGGKRRVLLVILDGWGIGEKDDTNPIHLAPTPNWDQLRKGYSCSQLEASGNAVGLKAGKAGNSEAGHTNIGAGRVVLQDDMRLDLAMQDGSFYSNETFRLVIDGVKQRGTNLHLIGLLSEKSSHGSIDYPLALLKLAKQQGLDEVYLHMIFDGRSTIPGSSPDLLARLADEMAEIGIGKIVSGVGRGLALDRDGNYDKTRRAFDGFVSGIGRKYSEE